MKLICFGRFIEEVVVYSFTTTSFSCETKGGENTMVQFKHYVKKIGVCMLATSLLFTNGCGKAEQKDQQNVDNQKQDGYAYEQE